MDLQSGARGLLHHLDAVRRGRHGARQRLGLPADLSRPDPDLRLRQRPAGAAGVDRAPAEHQLDLASDLGALRALAATGRIGDDHRLVRRRALCGPAVQGHQRQHPGIGTGQQRSWQQPVHRYRALRGGDHGPVRHALRRPRGQRHGTPSRPVGGGGAGVGGQAGGADRGCAAGPGARQERLAGSAGARGCRPGVVARAIWHADLSHPDPSRRLRHLLSAAAVPGWGGGVHRSCRSETGAAGIHRLSGAGVDLRAAGGLAGAGPGPGREPRSPAAAPAPGKRPSRHRHAGLHRWSVGGYGDGHRRLRGTVDHDQQRSADAAADADTVAATAAERRSVRLGAGLQAGVDCAAGGIGFRLLSHRRWQRHARQLRLAGLQRRRPVRPGAGGLAVLAQCQSARRGLGPGRRFRGLDLHPAAAAAVAGGLGWRRIPAKRPVGICTAGAAGAAGRGRARSADPRHALVPAGEFGAADGGVAATTTASGRTPAGHGLSGPLRAAGQRRARAGAACAPARSGGTGAAHPRTGIGDCRLRALFPHAPARP